MHPIMTLILNAVASFSSDYLPVASLIETSILLGLITFIQVYFMKTKAASISMTTKGNSGTNFGSGNGNGKRTTTSNSYNDSKNDNNQVEEI